MLAERNLLTCTVCRTQQPGTATVVAQLDGAPCMLVRCPGRLRREARAENYYRRLYASSDMRRIVAREHTGLLDDRTRLEYESQFKQSTSEPDAPNVLVATPTLEMGIDIGDLSAVCSRRCRRRSPPTCSGSAGPGGSPAARSTSPSSPAGASSCPGWRTRCRSSTARSAPPPRTCRPRRSCGGSTSPTWSTASPAPTTGRTRGWPRGALGSAEPGTLHRRADPLRRGRRPRVTSNGSSAASTTWPSAPVESLRGWATPADGEPDSAAAWRRTCSTRRSAGSRPSRGSRAGGPPSSWSLPELAADRGQPGGER